MKSLMVRISPLYKTTVNFSGDKFSTSCVVVWLIFVHTYIYVSVKNGKMSSDARVSKEKRKQHHLSAQASSHGRSIY